MSQLTTTPPSVDDLDRRIERAIARVQHGKRIVTIEQACKILKVKESTIQRAVKKGHLNVISRLGSDGPKFWVHDLWAYAESRTTRRHGKDNGG